MRKKRDEKKNKKKIRFNTLFFSFVMPETRKNRKLNAERLFNEVMVDGWGRGEIQYHTIFNQTKSSITDYFECKEEFLLFINDSTSISFLFSLFHIFLYFCWCSPRDLSRRKRIDSTNYAFIEKRYAEREEKRSETINKNECILKIHFIQLMRSNLLS